jgi:hypothetical protein
MKLYPKCIQASYNDGEKAKPPALSARGFFYPCCWCDKYEEKADKEFENLTKEHLRVENVEDVEDIFASDEWADFFDILINDPDNAPSVCKRMCGKDRPTKEYIYFE